MTQYPFDRTITNELEVLDYYLDAIKYRNAHKAVSGEIALEVFDRTRYQGRLPFTLSKEAEQLRYEFRSLEAPGAPDNYEQDYSEYEDELWKHLYNLIVKLKEQ